MTTMMACGHAANATTDGNPVCVICVGIFAGADVPVAPPDLGGRESQCSDCGRTTPSRVGLPFFEYAPGRPHDRHYDGCRGWD